MNETQTTMTLLEILAITPAAALLYPLHSHYYNIWRSKGFSVYSHSRTITELIVMAQGVLLAVQFIAFVTYFLQLIQ